MLSISGTVVGMVQVEQVLGSLQDVSIDAVERGMGRGILLGQSIVRGNARGRPGPRAPTGDFNRSIVGQYQRRGYNVIGQIGSNAAQARRLELGFTGRDILGRYYDQPPYPYLSTSYDAVATGVADQIREALRDDLK